MRARRVDQGAQRGTSRDLTPRVKSYENLRQPTGVVPDPIPPARSASTVKEGNHLALDGGAGGRPDE